MVEKDKRDRYASEEVNYGGVARNLWRDASFNPEAKPVEAPRGRPADQRPEHQRVGDFADRAESCPVIIGSEKANAIAARNALPVARTHLDQRLRILRPELER